MSRDEEQNIIQELNARFQELRALMITIGSVIAMLLAGLNEVGFISFAVDSLVDWVEDNPDKNPYAPCEENWMITSDHYIVDGDLYITVDILDDAWCNTIHTVWFNATMMGQTQSEESAPFRNAASALFEFPDIDEGTHRVSVTVENGSIFLFAMEVIDFEYDQSEEENAVYGCTDSAATNYNEVLHTKTALASTRKRKKRLQKIATLTSMTLYPIGMKQTNRFTTSLMLIFPDKQTLPLL